MARNVKQLNDFGIVNPINSGEHSFILTTDDGIGKQASLTTVTKAIADNLGVDVFEDGVFVRYLDSASAADTYPKMAKPSDYAKMTNKIALGIAIISGDKSLVVGLDTGSFPFGNSGTIAGTTQRPTANAAINEGWIGQQNTLAINTASSTTYPAANRAMLYSKLGSGNNGYAAGKWWLPSLSELLFIIANISKVNRALSTIGATTISGTTPFISSTQCDSTYVWGVVQNGVDKSYTIGRYSKSQASVREIYVTSLASS